MKNAKVLALLMVVLFLFSVSPIAGSAAMYARGEKSISGMITEDGMLQADDGKEYVITGKMADELKQKAGQKVQVTGTVQESEGQWSINVDKFQAAESVPGPEQTPGKEPMKSQEGQQKSAPRY